MNQQDKSFLTTFVTVMSVLVLIAVAIFMVSQLVSVVAITPVDGTREATAVADRIEPVGQVAVAEPSDVETTEQQPAAEVAAAAPEQTAAEVTSTAPAEIDLANGQQVYSGICMACHATGAAGAPMITDKAAWDTRAQQGMDTLVNHAVNGIGAMPAKGGNPSLSEGDIRNAVAYMLDEAGVEMAAAEPAAEPTAEEAPSEPTAAPATAEKAVPAISQEVLQQVMTAVQEAANAAQRSAESAQTAADTAQKAVDAVASLEAAPAEPAPAKEAAPTEEAALTDKAPPAEESAPVEETTPTEEATPPTEATAPEAEAAEPMAGEPAVEPTSEETTPVTTEPAAAPTEQATPTEEPAPAAEKQAPEPAAEPQEPAPAAEEPAPAPQQQPASSIGIPDDIDLARGKQVYNTACVICHQAGVAGAPKLDDQTAWNPRLQQGFDTLVSHAINGFKNMPPKGGRVDIPDEEIAAAVGFMVSEVQ